MSFELRATLCIGSALLGACTPGANGDLASLSEEDRALVLFGAFQESGLECPSILDVQRVDDVGEHWRILCGDGNAYLATVDPDGIALEPLLYGDLDLTRPEQRRDPAPR